jgi:putative transposase
MKRERFTEEQIIGSMSSVRRRPMCAASTEATFDKWKSKFGGREVSEAKRLKALQKTTVKMHELHLPSAGSQQRNRRPEGS